MRCEAAAQSSLWSLLLPAELRDSRDILRLRTELVAAASSFMLEFEMERERSQGLALGSFSRMILAEDIRSRSFSSSSRLGNGDGVQDFSIFTSMNTHPESGELELTSAFKSDVENHY